MAKAKLPPASDWRARNLDDWNTTTFRTYLADRHAELYGIPYVARNYGAEAGMLKRMIDEYGQAVTKAFIDVCFAEYRPTRQYPGINFAFMYGFMRARNLPRVLAEMKRAELNEQPAETGASNEIESKEWW